jgi:hypothetical protein
MTSRNAKPPIIAMLLYQGLVIVIVPTDVSSVILLPSRFSK